VHATLRLTPEVGQLRTKQKLREMKAAFRAAHGEDEAQFRVVHFSIQNTHIHLIVEAGNRERLSRGITGLAVRLARRLNRLVGRKGRVFSDRYHARPLRTPSEARHALAYVLLNARHHARHAPPRGTIDPCSSGALFDGWDRPCRYPRSYRDEDPEAATRPPTTWLLRVGWQRRGLISPNEIPSARRPE